MKKSFFTHQLEQRLYKMLFILLSCLLLSACATSPTGRTQLTLFSEGELAQMGSASFDQIKEEEKINTNRAVNQYVQCVSDALLAVSGTPEGWEVVVFDAEGVNAFALPGKKIGVHTGLLKVAETPDQLAAVIGHEIGHVQARHGNERVSTAFATQAGLALIGAVVASGEEPSPALMAALGLGAQVGVMLPFSRQHELEADLIGLDLMARAGFDPQQSITLWQNMSRSGGGQSVEFLSTHPGHETRIRTLQQSMPGAMDTYNRARAAGKNPTCRPPARI
ncbi:M48 family metallopeptidase [Nitrincola alkalilacustris]|uniref:M48 family metallopeptidase n=1 Tax=Nitrincola alkalilacustris TaxID=1571224 RepID=UPI001F115DF7|nr:M48 family metallopeptidase [Nitrincola alkalilacustris]